MTAVRVTAVLAQPAETRKGQNVPDLIYLAGADCHHVTAGVCDAGALGLGAPQTYPTQKAEEQRRLQDRIGSFLDPPDQERAGNE